MAGERATTVVLAWTLAVGAAACGAQTADPGLVASLDSAVRAHLEHPLVAGVSVAVVRGGETLLQRGYGQVDLEWDVPTPVDADASYEIGSVTKQFTAAALLLLAEDGLVDLDADLSTYLDFDTRGRTVPVRRLLDHTSGIKGYTEMPIFGELVTRKLPRDSLVRVVEREPFEFEPGTALIYNNSAYFLLGLLVEEVTGRSYAEVVTERIFEPVGMTDSYYCSEAEVRARRAHGYDAAGPDSLARAGYLDHTWPYAAGSLCSTVADLVKWNQALHGGELLEAASYRAMITPRPLVDGTSIRYAMGLGVTERGDGTVIAHGGGINGFLSQLSWHPEAELSVVVLQNSTGPGPGALANALAEVVLGPVGEPESPPFTGDFGALTGSYAGPSRGRTMTVSVLVEDGQLAVRTGDDDAEPTRPSYRGGLRWDAGNARYLFIGADGGAPARELRVDHVGGHYVLRRVGG